MTRRARLALATTLLSTACAGTAAARTTVPGTTPPSATAPAVAPLRIMVTNDDGVKAPGIDAVVQALLTLPDVQVTVVAPANNQSGTGNRTTPGNLLVVDSATASGYPAKAVGGFPADTVVWALDQHGVSERPDLVVSGINAGQNLGWVSNELSGTVGAARAAARHGIPAIAASQGLPPTADVPFDFASGATQVLSWITAHRGDLHPGTHAVSFTNMNIPTCPVDHPIRGTLDVAGGTVDDGRPVLAPADCASAVPAPTTDDVDAFNAGFVAVSVLPAPVPPTPDTSPDSTPGT